MIIDTKVNSSAAFLPDTGKTTIFVNEDDQLRLKKADGSVSTIVELKTDDSTRQSALLDGTDNQLVVDPGVHKTFKWFASTFKSRAMSVILGKTRYLDAIDLYNAVKVNGSTNVELQAAIDFALTVANENQRVVLIDHDITLNGNINIPNTVKVVSRGVGKVTASAATPRTITIGANCVLAGVDFNGTIKVDLTTVSGGASNTKIVANRWTNNIIPTQIAGNDPCICISETGTVDNTYPVNVTIALNESTNSRNFMYGRFLKDSVVAQNKYIGERGEHRAPTSTIGGRMFVMWGGFNNEFYGNIGIGGIVGHGVLLRRDFSRGWYGNNVWGNYFENISEEGISVDINGNSAAGMAVLDRLVITAVSGTWSNNPVLRFNRANLTGITTAAVNCALEVLSGPLAGKYLNFVQINTITADSVYGFQLRNRTLLESELAQLVGANVAVVIRCDNNRYANNTLVDVYSPIYFYGMGWESVVTGNRSLRTDPALPVNPFRGDFIFQGVGVLSPTSASTPAAYSCVAIPSYNYISNNDGIVSFEGYAWGNGNTSANVEPYVDPVPSTVSGNLGIAPIIPWYPDSGRWEGTKVSHVIENDGAPFVPYIAGAEVDLSIPKADVQLLNKFARNVSLSFAAGAVSVSVNHGLTTIPSRFTVTPTDRVSASKLFFVTPTVTNLVITYYDSPTGVVTGATVTTAGTGYTTAPTLTFSDPPAGGTRATATATVSGGAITAVNIVNPGSGYTTAPTITIGGPGTGGVLTATFSAATTLNFNITAEV